ncbi:aldolase catalytic domain-containing protein [Aquimarina sp. M1]
MKTEILDCTLRDGGYYTKWDFDDILVEEYAKSMEALPIKYVEIGYRSTPLEGYLGEYFYCPEYVLKNLKALMPSKELVIILNEKDIRDTHILEGLLDPCINYVSMVRIAVDPKSIGRALKLAKAVKKIGFKVAFNVMYMSNWEKDTGFLNNLKGIEEIVDYFYMVDSFGGVMPEDVKKIVALVRSKTKVPLGFHGHNNLEMALINTITAVESGCDIIDATITGMGRGAGNLKTELLLTYLESKKGLTFTHHILSKVVGKFEELRKQYQWGTSFPYMFSGAKSLPQKQVMEWIGLNRYPLGSIINALHNQKQEVRDNLKLPELKKTNKYTKAVILGGGKSAKEHKKAIEKFLENNEHSICLVHAGVRNAKEYLEIEGDQYYGLVGFESDKLLDETKSFSNVKHMCVYPPFPRRMGTSIPEEMRAFSQELQSITFTDVTTDSPMAIAIQVALDLGVNEIYLIGFDGYDVNLNQNQFVIAQENQKVIDDAVNISGVNVRSFTPTKYKSLEVLSIYSFL